MIKRLVALKRIVPTLVLVLSMGMGVAWASGTLPGGGWYSVESVQNVGTADGGVSIVAYDQASTTSYSASSSVAMNNAVTISPDQFAGMSPGFSGSAIVSSDQPAVAVATITNVRNGSFGVTGGRARARYEATLNPQKTLYFPLVKHNWYGRTTLFYIQNAEASATITAQAVFAMDNGGVYTFTTPSIGPGQMVVVSPADAGVPSNGNNANRNNIGGLTVSSSGNLAGNYIEYIIGEAVSTAISSMRGIEPTDIDTTNYVPTIKRAYYTRFTGLSVLNADSVPITVTVDYVGTNHTCRGLTYRDIRTNIVPGKSANIVHISTQSTLPDDCLAAATVTAGGKQIVTLVNEQEVTGNPTAMIVYYATGPNAATAKVAAPTFSDQYADGSGSYNSGLQLQNVGQATATNVVVSFYCKHTGNPDYIAQTVPLSITAGAAVQFYRPSDARPSNATMIYNDLFATGYKFQSHSLCSIIATGDQKLGANINDESIPSGALDDANYVGFNLTP